MIIFIEDGIIKWKQFTNGFPFEYLVHGTKVPVYSVAADLYYNGATENKPEKVDAIEWFPEDFAIKSKPKLQLWEQAFKVSQTSILSCLWTF